MEYAKSDVLNKEVKRKCKDTPSHSNVLYTEDRGRHKARDLGVEVKAEASKNSRIQILHVIIVEIKDILKDFVNN